jgi:hypothetical protein
MEGLKTLGTLVVTNGQFRKLRRVNYRELLWLSC